MTIVPSAEHLFCSSDYCGGQRGRGGRKGESPQWLLEYVSGRLYRKFSIDHFSQPDFLVLYVCRFLRRVTQPSDAGVILLTTAQAPLAVSVLQAQSPRAVYWQVCSTTPNFQASSFLQDLGVCVCVKCLHESMCTLHSQVPSEARRHWIPWSWSCEPPNVASGYQTLVLFEGREHSSQLSHLSNPVLKLLGVDINTGFMYMYLCFFFSCKNSNDSYT